MNKMALEEARQRLVGLPGWQLEGEAIAREFRLASFPDAVALVVKLGFAAEAADHHPDIHVSYKRVRVTYWTHSAGGLTEKDFEGALTAEKLAGTP